MMPEMDGIEVLRRLKSEQRTCHIPVIIITALTGEADVATSLEEGAIDHISKPFSELIVKTRVRAALRSRGALRSLLGKPLPKRGRCFGFTGNQGRCGGHHGRGEHGPGHYGSATVGRDGRTARLAGNGCDDI
jgi:DNA-binding response OmpR family regulator